MFIKCSKTGSGITMSREDFNAIRQYAACCTSDAFGELYPSMSGLFSDASAEFFSKFILESKTIPGILKHSHKKTAEVMAFFFQPESEGTVSVRCCEEVKHILETRSSAASGSPAHIDDFLHILQECVDNKSSMEWCEEC